MPACQHLSAEAKARGRPESDMSSGFGVEESKLARASARRSGGLCERQVTPQTALSLGQPQTALSLGQPRPASASLGQPRPAVASLGHLRPALANRPRSPRWPRWPAQTVFAVFPAQASGTTASRRAGSASESVRAGAWSTKTAWRLRRLARPCTRSSWRTQPSSTSARAGASATPVCLDRIRTAGLVSSRDPATSRSQAHTQCVVSA